MPKPKIFGWCEEHGVHECPLCHPEVAQLKETPKLDENDLDRAAGALHFAQRQENNRRCRLHLRRIQFVSAEAVDRAGIDIDLVDTAPIVESVRANGKITYDQTRVTHLSTRVPGNVWQVEKKLGDRVEAGEVLALIDAVEVGRAKAELLQALERRDLAETTYDRLASLGEDVVAGSRIREAETVLRNAKLAVAGARQTLVNLGLPVSLDESTAASPAALAARIRFLGLPDSLSKQIDPKVASENLIPLATPIGGVVTHRAVAAGEVVSSAKTLFTVTDTDQMWLTLDVRLEDAQPVAIGQTVHFLPDGSSQEAVGQISWISTGVDSRTRTVKVRAELANLDGQLRDETFGSGRIILREQPDAIVVPNEAVHWEGCCHVVFVRDKAFFDENSYKVFHTRSVRPAVKTPKVTEIAAGLLPGEVIATVGSGALAAELLRGNIGAG